MSDPDSRPSQTPGRNPSLPSSAWQPSVFTPLAQSSFFFDANSRFKFDPEDDFGPNSHISAPAPSMSDPEIHCGLPSPSTLAFLSPGLVSSFLGLAPESSAPDATQKMANSFPEHTAGLPSTPKFGGSDPIPIPGAKCAVSAVAPPSGEMGMLGDSKKAIEADYASLSNRLTSTSTQKRAEREACRVASDKLPIGPELSQPVPKPHLLNSPSRHAAVKRAPAKKKIVADPDSPFVTANSNLKNLSSQQDTGAYELSYCPAVSTLSTSIAPGCSRLIPPSGYAVEEFKQVHTTFSNAPSTEVASAPFPVHPDIPFVNAPPAGQRSTLAALLSPHRNGGAQPQHTNSGAQFLSVPDRGQRTVAVKNLDAIKFPTLISSPSSLNWSSSNPPSRGNINSVPFGRGPAKATHALGNSTAGRSTLFNDSSAQAGRKGGSPNRNLSEFSLASFLEPTQLSGPPPCFRNESDISFEFETLIPEFAVNSELLERNFGIPPTNSPLPRNPFAHTAAPSNSNAPTAAPLPTSGFLSSYNTPDSRIKFVNPDFSSPSRRRSPSPIISPCSTVRPAKLGSQTYLQPVHPPPLLQPQRPDLQIPNLYSDVFFSPNYPQLYPTLLDSNNKDTDRVSTGLGDSRGMTIRTDLAAGPYYMTRSHSTPITPSQRTTFSNNLGMAQKAGGEEMATSLSAMAVCSPRTTKFEFGQALSFGQVDVPISSTLPEQIYQYLSSGSGANHASPDFQSGLTEKAVHPRINNPSGHVQNRPYIRTPASVPRTLPSQTVISTDMQAAPNWSYRLGKPPVSTTRTQDALGQLLLPEVASSEFGSCPLRTRPGTPYPHPTPVPDLQGRRDRPKAANLQGSPEPKYHFDFASTPEPTGRNTPGTLNRAFTVGASSRSPPCPRGDSATEDHRRPEFFTHHESSSSPTSPSPSRRAPPISGATNSSFQTPQPTRPPPPPPPTLVVGSNFINFTALDSDVLLRGVAPSGISKSRSGTSKPRPEVQLDPGSPSSRAKARADERKRATGAVDGGRERREKAPSNLGKKADTKLSSSRRPCPVSSRTYTSSANQTGRVTEPHSSNLSVSKSLKRIQGSGSRVVKAKRRSVDKRSAAEEHALHTLTLDLLGPPTGEGQCGRDSQEVFCDSVHDQANEVTAQKEGLHPYYYTSGSLRQWLAGQCEQPMGKRG